MEFKYSVLIICVASVALICGAPTTSLPYEWCPEGQEYQACGTACPASCEKPRPKTCSDACVAGCFCVNDAVLHNGVCVPRHTCPDLQNDSRRKGSHQANSEDWPLASGNTVLPATENRSKAGRDLKDRAPIIWDFSQLWATSTTTLGYEEWWFPPTPKRPLLNWKDYPGRAGVAEWKEISPNGEVKKSGKESGPTAAGVTSGHLCNKPLNSLIAIILIATCFHHALNIHKWITSTGSLGFI